MRRIWVRVAGSLAIGAAAALLVLSLTAAASPFIAAGAGDPYGPGPAVVETEAGEVTLRPAGGCWNHAPDPSAPEILCALVPPPGASSIRSYPQVRVTAGETITFRLGSQPTQVVLSVGEIAGVGPRGELRSRERRYRLDPSETPSWTVKGSGGPLRLSVRSERGSAGFEGILRTTGPGPACLNVVRFRGGDYRARAVVGPLPAGRRLGLAERPPCNDGALPSLTTGTAVPGRPGAAIPVRAIRGVDPAAAVVSDRDRQIMFVRGTSPRAR